MNSVGIGCIERRVKSHHHSALTYSPISQQWNQIKKNKRQEKYQRRKEALLYPEKWEAEKKRIFNKIETIYKALKRLGSYERAIRRGKIAYEAHLAKKPHGEIPIYKTKDGHFDYVWNEFYPAPKDTYLLWHPEAFEHPQTYEHCRRCARDPHYCLYEFGYADAVIRALQCFQVMTINNQERLPHIEPFHQDIKLRIEKWQEEARASPTQWENEKIRCFKQLWIYTMK